jgi:predicted nucleic acid-binding protein
MTAAVFVDTNVFVYARDASEPGKQPAASLCSANIPSRRQLQCVFMMEAAEH